MTAHAGRASSACSPQSAPAAIASRRRKASLCRMSRARSCSASAHGAACRVQPGAGHQGAPIGHALHRPLGRPLAGMDGRHQRRVLRRGARRHRADGVLLSRPGCEGRRPAAAQANAPRCGMASCSRRCRSSSCVLAVGSYAQEWHLGEAAGTIVAGDDARLAQAYAAQEAPAHAAAAAPVLAQQ